MLLRAVFRPSLHNLVLKLNNRGWTRMREIQLNSITRMRESRSKHRIFSVDYRAFRIMASEEECLHQKEALKDLSQYRQAST